MSESRLSVWDRGFAVLAVVPVLLAFVVPTLVFGAGTEGKFARHALSYTGMGLGVVLFAIGVLLVRGTAGRRRIWLALSASLAVLPAALLAFGIGLQWAVVLVVELFGG